ncbi:phosphomannomutase [Gluconobacter cerinus]
MSQSKVAFGTSGARGLVNAMTDAVCFAYTVGYLKHLESLGEFYSGAPVALAGDLRPSTLRILRACVAAIVWMKGAPVFCGFVPTPALSLYAFARKIPSLMVTGSHIPDNRNGIKFNRAQGEFLKADEAAMHMQDVFLPKGWFDEQGALVKDVSLPSITNVEKEYITRYQNFFGSDALSGLVLGVYQHSAVGRDTLVEIVKALGGTAIPLARSETFVSVDTEAVRSEDIVLAREWAEKDHYHAILTTDGDSDRPLLADHKGHWLRGDVLGILAAKTLGAEVVVTPVSSNTALEAADFVRSVRRTRIGSPFVIAEMDNAVAERFSPVLGYEANGGFLVASDVKRNDRLLTALPTRDAVLPILSALIAAREAGLSLADLVKTLPHRFTVSDRLAELPTDVSLKRLAALRLNISAGIQALGVPPSYGAVRTIDETDGLRMTFEGGEILHLRPSGNAPELRIYVEADSEEEAKNLLMLSLHGANCWKE